MTATSTIALVTGGNRGIGRGIAESLARHGTDVVITYRSHPEEAEDVVAAIADLGRAAIAVHLDTGRSDTFAQFAEDLTVAVRDTWGRDSIDFLVNNAGINIDGKLAAISEDDFDALVTVDFKGTVFLTQKLLALIADGGRIINVTSSSTRYMAGDTVGVYASIKSAIDTYTHYLASELAPRQITANTVAPGATLTDLGGGYMRRNEQAVNARAAEGGIGRIGRPDDIGGVVTALLHADSNWITGQRIEASGGERL